MAAFRNPALFALMSGSPIPTWFQLMRAPEIGYHGNRYRIETLKHLKEIKSSGSRRVLFFVGGGIWVCCEGEGACCRLAEGGWVSHQGRQCAHQLGPQWPSHQAMSNQICHQRPAPMIRTSPDSSQVSPCLLCTLQLLQHSLPATAPIPAKYYWWGKLVAFIKGLSDI